jgi:IS30 family transposase
VARQVQEHRWSLDACAGYARLHGLFPEGNLVCTKTLYNELWAGRLALTLFEMPGVLKRKRHRGKNRQNRRVLGNSIELRPKIASKREEEGHWEGDTVIGLRSGKEAVVLTLIEKKTLNYSGHPHPRQNQRGRHGGDEGSPQRIRRPFRTGF